MSVHDYQCWPDETGLRVYFRHKCKDGYETTLLPKGRWTFDGQKLTPSVNCDDCGFHMFIEKTHDIEPILCPLCNSSDITEGHHAGSFAVPECHYKQCQTCNHQWGHE